MTTLREAAQQALEVMQTNAYAVANEAPHRDLMAYFEAIAALAGALTEEALQRLTDVHQEIESMIVDEGCFERGCACHDSRESPGVVVVKQPEQEPVAWANMKGDGTFALLSISQHQEDRANWMHPVPLFTHPPRREWRGLTEEEVDQMAGNTVDAWECARAIEATLKERNA
jgi:hypothetical protein